jgi:DNA-directed RNA polymerase II subunit RPB1
MSYSSHPYDEKRKPIKFVDFAIFGNKEVRDISAVRKEPHGINTIELYENLEAKKGGLNDPRLGVTGIYSSCKTCGLQAQRCPGHFGHTELASYVHHIEFHRYVEKILSCVCLRCSKLLVQNNQEQLNEMLKNKKATARFAEVKRLTKNIPYCSNPGYGCGSPVPKIKIVVTKSQGSLELVAEFDQKHLGGEQKEEKTKSKKKKTVKQVLTPEMCYEILRNISDTDRAILGIDPEVNKVEDLLIKNLPIPPPQVRPSARIDLSSSATMEDHLTKKLTEIVNVNNELRLKKEKMTDQQQTSKQISVIERLLQLHVITYIDNEKIAMPKVEVNRVPYKSLTSRLKAKEGRIRGNLMGKRVEFSSRTVITPDPYLPIDELAVPLKIAMVQTYPEIVSPHNIEWLTKLVKNGRYKYPGANYVISASSLEKSGKARLIDLRFNKKNIPLRFGDRVERHLQNGDYVLFNRQPSLHKISMQAFKVRVFEDPNMTTFRFNPAACLSFNADFDGDGVKFYIHFVTKSRLTNRLLDIPICENSGSLVLDITY